MKTNAIYFLILTCLLTFTYFFQELKEREKYDEKDRREILFNEKVYGDFLGFHLNGTDFFKGKNGHFKIKKNIPISQDKVLKVLNTLSGLRVEKILPITEKDLSKNKKFFFPDKEKKITFKFKNQRMVFSLGQKLSYSQSFYFKIDTGKKSLWGIAKDVSETFSRVISPLILFFIIFLCSPSIHSPGGTSKITCSDRLGKNL